MMDDSIDYSLEELTDGLLTSDLASEIRSEFNHVMERHRDVAAATSHVVSTFGSGLGNPDEGPVIILSLALLQLIEQKLYVAFRDAAIDLIDSGEALAAFPASTGDLKKQRKDLLERFAEKLREAKTADE